MQTTTAKVMELSKALTLVHQTSAVALRVVQPIVAPAQLPQECMAIVMRDPERVQEVFNDPTKMQGIQTCVMGKQSSFESEIIGDGACSASDLHGDGPPCGNPKCISAVKSSVRKMVDDCIPEADFQS